MSKLILQAQAEELCQMMLDRIGKSLGIDPSLMPLIDNIEIIKDGDYLDLHINKYTTYEDSRYDDIKKLYNFVLTHRFSFAKGLLCDDTKHIWYYDMSINDTKEAHPTERVVIHATEIDPVNILRMIQADIAKYPREED